MHVNAISHETSRRVPEGTTSERSLTKGENVADRVT